MHLWLNFTHRTILKLLGKAIFKERWNETTVTSILNKRNTLIILRRSVTLLCTMFGSLAHRVAVTRGGFATMPFAPHSGGCGEPRQPPPPPRAADHLPRHRHRNRPPRSARPGHKGVSSPSRGEDSWIAVFPSFPRHSVSLTRVRTHIFINVIFQGHFFLSIFC